jgi:hypothetical protein
MLSVGDVFMRPRVSIPLGKAEINDVHRVVMPTEPDQKIVRLDVTVDEALTETITIRSSRLNNFRTHHIPSCEETPAGSATAAPA